jgi:hypothetical protein
MTPGRLWWLLRRDWNRGWEATYHDYLSTPRIRRWRHPHAHGQTEAVPVHVLTSRENLPLGEWMLASWVHFTDRNWLITVHGDPTVEDSDFKSLRRLFPGIQTTLAHDRDAAMLGALESFPRCLEYRRRHPLAHKIFDIPLIASRGRFVLLDTDVLFYRRPVEILDWCAGKVRGCWFNRDASDALTVPASQWEALVGVRPWEAVNSGLCLIEADAIDLPLCEQSLAQSPLLERNLWRVEQTLFALCAARAGPGGLLPETYEVSLGRRARPGAVARHYVGAVRQQFFAEGVRLLAPILLAERAVHAAQ